MESEKVKEIKEALQQEIHLVEYVDDLYANNVSLNLLKDTLTLINELEKENERINNIALNENITVREWLQENKRLKDRIAKLEKANELLRNAKVVYEIVDYCYEDLKKAEKRIDELEKENKRLKAEKQKVLEYMKTDNYAKLKKADMYWGYQMGIGMLEHEIDRQKYRIAELEKENARLLNSVETVQSNRCVYKCELTKEHLKKFAEKLKEKMTIHYPSVIESIDEILKEFLK